MLNQSGGNRDAEFEFWGANQATDQYHHNAFNGGRDACDTEDEFYDCSPSLWKTAASSLAYETSPLLRWSHQSDGGGRRDISTRSRVIAEGRRQLMEMVTNMPESHYELSLKDIVDDGGGDEEEKKEAVSGCEEQQGEVASEEASFCFCNNGQATKARNKATKVVKKAGTISRIGSMEKETFLIKTFIPSSFSWKTKVKGENGSNVSCSLSFRRPEKQAHKDWWIKRLLVKGSSCCSSSSSSSSSSSNGSEHRLCRCRNETRFLSGCWPLLRNKKSKHRECFF